MRVATRFAASSVVLVLVLLLADGRGVAEQLARLEPRWTPLAFGIGVMQVGLSAWRWRFTARRLGLELAWPVAFAEYYLATFLNQVLPGGVTGDVARAWRHGRVLSSPGPAVRAVMIERASGQIVMAAVALAAVLVLPEVPAAAVGMRGWGVAAAALLLGVFVLTVLARTRAAGVVYRFGADIRRALLSPRAFVVQLASSLAVVGSYILVFVIAARALGIGTPIGVLLPLIPLVLLAMLIPFSVSGWGFREAAAGMIWPLAGLPATEGVAVAVAYGLLVLLGSLPGALVLLLSPGPGRRRQWE